jgi:flavodoxin
MTRALVLYNSRYGNTKTVAEALAKGIGCNGIDVECASIEEIDVQRIPDFEFIAIGGPTHVIRTSKEMKDFLARIRSLDLRGRMGFAFDTRIESRMNQKKWGIFENSAARRIQKVLKQMKMQIIKERESAIVNENEGPLMDGTEKRFEEIGIAISALIGA